MKKVLLRILSIWAVLMVALYFIVLLPIYLLLIQFRNERVRTFVHRMNGVWSRWFFLVAGIRVKRHGYEKLDRKQIYVFAPNHTSYIDIPLCNIAVRHSFRFLGKAEIRKMPLFGYMFTKVHIPVDRDSRTNSFRSFQRVNVRLRRGVSVLIYPEGTIPDKHEVDLKSFKTGAFRAALDTQTPLVPVVILNAHHVFPDNNEFLIHPGTIHVHFLDPIPTAGRSADDFEAFKEEVREKMLVAMRELGYRNLSRK
jgi:1-acyl-sn-glycerol-3-phosphate acyltransferase